MATGCSSGPVQCGACAGPGYVLSGVPDVLRHAVVTVCTGDHPCRTIRDREPLRTQGQQFLELPSGTRWDDYDGVPVRVSVRASQGRWEGTGTFDYTPSDGSPCDCGSLVAEVPLTAR